MNNRNKSTDSIPITTDSVRSFWQKNPLCAKSIPYRNGSREYFEQYDKLREEIEPISYSYSLHEYSEFKGKMVLDVGSGNGYVLSKYAREGANVYGIDITDVGIKLCRERFEHFGIKGNFEVADAQDIPFQDNTFDCVCSMGVLHHVPNTSKALDEIYRVLKPGGRLIVMFYHRNSAKYQFMFRIRSWLTGKSLDQLVNEFDGVGNPKGTVFSRSELRNILHKFHDVKTNVGYLSKGDLNIFRRGSRYLPTFVVKFFEPLWGWNLYAKARK